MVFIVVQVSVQVAVGIAVQVQVLAALLLPLTLALTLALALVLTLALSLTLSLTLALTLQLTLQLTLKCEEISVTTSAHSETPLNLDPSIVSLSKTTIAGMMKIFELKNSGAHIIGSRNESCLWSCTPFHYAVFGNKLFCCWGERPTSKTAINKSNSLKYMRREKCGDWIDIADSRWKEIAGQRVYSALAVWGCLKNDTKTTWY